MGVISRGIRNAFRNGIRTTSIVFILAISISMALVMLMSLRTVQTKIDSVKSSIGNNITVTPAGVRGFEGGGEALTVADATTLGAIPHVTKVVQSISDRLESADTNLVSAIEPGSFGTRQQGRQNRQSPNGESATQTAPTNFTMPINVSGTSDLDSTASINASKFDITSGEKMDTTSADNIAMIGTELATKNNLVAGSSFTAYGQTITVKGIFDAGNKFANAGVIMPIATLQNLSGQTSQITSMIVTVDSIDAVTNVQSQIKINLADRADVASQQDSSAEAVKPLENIKTISLYSLIGSLVAGAVIIFLTMLMIVRERRREIGVLKAIGSSNVGIMAMFTVESLVLTFISSVAGVLLGLAFSNPVLNVMVNNAQSESAPSNFAGGGAGRAMMRFGGGAVGGVQNAVRDLHAVVGWDILLYGLLAAVIIAIIGSAIPAFFISKIRPAEVMRAE
ncbi:MAG: FtsX-like permease family protein [bacterium]